MRHDKLERELNLLLMLTENRNHTVQDFCDRLQISRRNFYYYLEFFRLAGFIVEHRKPFYSISRQSAFFRKMGEIVSFTEDEAVTLAQILDRTADESIQVQRLRQKLNRLYDLHILDSLELKEQLAHNVTTLYEAIKQRRTVKLIGYSSPHSNTLKDRIVEPYLFMNGNREIRCFELSSRQNKTFKLQRMQDVELLDVVWEHEPHHRPMRTDVFMFSGEEMVSVTLLMGRLATSVLREEYPRAERYIEPVDEGHWRVRLPVASFIGVGRFVLGLFSDIDVEENDDFKAYLREQINKLTNKQL
jgi:predicted DNA-binding transcriptional regulator YafY